MTDYFETMRSFLEEDGWHPTADEQDQILQMDFRTKDHTWRCYALIGRDPHQVVFYSIFPVVVPEATRLKLAEFLTRINCGIPIGNFELDFENGNIRFKTSIFMDGDPLRPALLQSLAYTNVAMMGHYFNSLMTAIHGDESAAEIAALMQLVS